MFWAPYPAAPKTKLADILVYVPRDPDIRKIGSRD
jgi:hypothetical protein